MTENIITAEGCAYNDLKRHLKEWIAINKTAIGPGKKFSIYKNGRGKHVIKTYDDIDNRLFTELYIFLKKSPSVSRSEIYGYTEIANEGWFPTELTNFKAMLFSLNCDQEDCKIYGITREGKVFSKHMVTGETAYPEMPNTYRSLINTSILGNPEVIKTPDIRESKSVREQKGRYKRLNGALIILGILYAVSLLVKDTYLFLQWNFWLPLAFIGYLFFDNGIPVMKGTFHKAFAASIAIFAYTVILSFYYKDTSYIFLTRTAGCGPLLFILMHRYMARGFKRWKGRQPDLDRDRFPDNMYWLVLFLGVMLISFLVGEKLLPILT